MSVKKCDDLSISPWIRRFSHLVADEERVLDLAAGGGRHGFWFLERGHHVTAIDRNIGALETRKATLSEDERQRFEIKKTDLEDGSPWPLAGRRFDVVIVVNYLHRPLFPDLLSALAPGGLLLYETFAVGQEVYGRPSNPDFLLKPGELLDRLGNRLQVIAYEHGRIDDGSGPAIKQRIAAIAGETPAPLTAS